MRNSHTYDNLLLLKDAGAISASAAAQVAGAARVIDMGNARFDARVLVDPSVLDLTTGDESYSVAVQGCNAINFGTGVVELAAQKIASADRHELVIQNQVGDTVYRYIRAYLTLAGTTPSINATIFMAKL